jgi:hypothetical protein
MKAKQASKALQQSSALETVLADVEAVVNNHKSLGTAIANQKDVHQKAIEKAKSLNLEVEEKELELALSHDAPDFLQKEEHVASLRAELAASTDAISRSTRVIEALETKSKGINEAVTRAAEGLMELARELAADQAEEVAAEIRESSKALARAIGKARNIGMGDIRPLSGFLASVRVPDPTDCVRRYTEEGWMVFGKSLISTDTPEVVEACQVVMASWEPLRNAMAALKECKPFESAPATQTPYACKGYTISHGTNQQAHEETEPPLQGFAAYRARGPQPYEIKGDINGFRTKQALARGAITANVDGVGVATREWIGQTEQEQAAQ